MKFIQKLKFICAYPTVHPADFVTYGILQAQPRRGTRSDWGQLAEVLDNMLGGRQTVVADLMVIVLRMIRLDRDGPMREAEEQNVLDYLLEDQTRSNVPRGVDAFPRPAVSPAATPTQRPTQGEPMRPLNVKLGPQEPRIGHVCLLILKLGPLVPRVGHVQYLSLSLGLQVPRLGHVKQITHLSRGPQGPRADLVVPHPASRTMLT